MARVSVPDTGDDLPDTTKAFRAYAPEIGAAAEAYSRAVYQSSLLTAREMEGARYRTAQINGCHVCQSFRSDNLRGHLDGLGGDISKSPIGRGPAPEEPFYEAVANWKTSPLFSDRERIAIEMAERMGERPKSMEGDEIFWSRVHDHFTDREIVDLTLSIASWMAMGRVVHTLEMDQVCAL